MASPILFYKNFTRRFYSAYRPILCSVVDDVGDVAYMRAELEREDSNFSENWLGTDIMADAYEDFTGSSGKYTFNVMGYVREFVGTEQYIEGTRFRLRIWAVRYPPSQGGGLIHDEPNYITSNGFHALATTTNKTQRYADTDFQANYDGFPSEGAHLYIDRLTLGSNSYLGNRTSDVNLLFSQNKWNPKIKGTQNLDVDTDLSYWRSSRASGAYTVNFDDAFDCNIQTPLSLCRGGLGASETCDFSKEWTYHFVFYAVVNQAGTTITHTELIEISGDLGTSTAISKIPAHAKQFDSFVRRNGGDPGSSIINISGSRVALVAGGVIVYEMAVIWDRFTTSNPAPEAVKYQEAPVMNYMKQWQTSTIEIGNTTPATEIQGSGSYPTPTYLDWSDEPSNGRGNECSTGEDGEISKLKRFKFQTGAGGYDWINIFGKESKETSFESVLYTKSPEHSTSHARTVLSNSREDVFKLVSQPVNKGISRHIEEMLTSPQVWLQSPNLYPHGGNFMYVVDDVEKYFWLPILIVPGSFTIYDTDEKHVFIEFSYTLSEPITSHNG